MKNVVRLSPCEKSTSPLLTALRFVMAAIRCCSSGLRFAKRGIFLMWSRISIGVVNDRLIVPRQQGFGNGLIFGAPSDTIVLTFRTGTQFVYVFGMRPRKWNEDRLRNAVACSRSFRQVLA